MEKLQIQIVMASVILVLAIAAVYAGVRSHDFVDYDDTLYVVENEAVLSGISAQSIGWAATTGYAGNWHPLTWVSLMLDVELWGVNAGAMALTNVLIHAVSSVLLLVFFIRSTGAFWPSMLVAVLFALHPLRVESVAWVAERKDVLAGLFFMLTLLGWLRYVKGPSLPRYAFVIFTLACGLMSKPTVVTLPFVLLLLDFWPLNRLHARCFWPRVREKIPLFLLALASSLMTLRVQAEGGAMRAEGLSLLDSRLANAASAYVVYLRKFAWPNDLACFYPLPSQVARESPWSLGVLASIALLAGCSILVWRARSSRPWLVTGWFWYVGVLVPMIGIVQVGNQAMADRYTYLSMIGVSILVAWTLHGLSEPWARRSVVAATGLSCVLFGFSSHRQVDVWRDHLTLFQNALRVTEGNYLAHYNVGTHFLRASPAEIEAARPHLEAAIRYDPTHSDARLNLGAVEFMQGRLEQATRHFEDAVRFSPNDSEARLSLGAARFEQGRTGDAISEFERAIALDPDNAKAHSNLGAIYLSIGRKAEAQRAFEQALLLVPTMPEAQSGMKAIRDNEKGFTNRTTRPGTRGSPPYRTRGRRSHRSDSTSESGR